MQYWCWIDKVEGMSDVSMYELEDIIWDDFDRSDDHIVPNSSNARGNISSCEGDSWKKPWREAPVLSNASNVYASDTVCQEKEERYSEPLKKRRIMLGMEPSSHAPNALTDSCDGDTIKEMPNLTSGDAKLSSNCFKSSNVTSDSEFCADDRIVSDTSAAGDSNSYDYPLTHISQTDDLNFLNNDSEDKESSDLLYYGWPDIGNFEDVDRMLRSCHSSFGFAVTENDDGLGWFAPEDPIVGTGEAMNMDFEFPSPEPSALNDISHDHDPRESSNHKSSYIAESKDELNLKNQIHLQKKQSKHQNQAVANKAGQCIGPEGPFYHFRDLKSDDTQLSSIDKSGQVLTSIGNHQQKRNLEPNCFGYMQSATSYLHQDYGYATNQTPAGPMLTGVKFENKGLTSPSPMESSYASNQVFSMESSGVPSFQGAATEVNEQKKVHHSHGFHPLFSGNARQVDKMFQASKSDPVLVQKQAHPPANELESQSDIEVVQKGDSAEKCSLNVPESSSISSESDEISLEATSFHQLRQVMEQLDLRTKLCIRDSLYRLAKSAEQRHNNGSLRSSAAGYKDTGQPLMAEGTNKCSGFMDMETDTNPIDRTIAHLLFHRPSDSPNMPAPLPLKPNAMAQGSILGPTMLAGKLVCQEAAAAAKSNDKIASD